MTFQASQFSDFIENCATEWDSINGLSPPASDTPDIDAAAVFSSYSATLGTADLSASYATHPESPYVWISGKPDPNGNFGMFMGNNLQRIVYHDAYWRVEGGVGFGSTTRGHGVAITPRHVICGVHGSEGTNGTLQWLLSNGTTLSRTINTSYAKSFVGSSGTAGYGQGFRLLYLTQDLPLECVCPLLNPNDSPNLDGAYVVCYNNYREMTVWEVVDVEEDNGSNGYALVIKKPTDSGLAKLWRPFNCTGSPYGTLDQEGPAVSGGGPIADAGSGSPFFLVFTNAAGQTQFAYFGVATNSAICSSTARGTSFIHAHDDVIDAVEDMNSYYESALGGGYPGDYVPKYLTDASWFAPSIEDELVSYWKLDESSGNRADTHGSYTLIDHNTVGSASGKVYSLAAAFVSENSEYLRTSGPYWFSGDITISAWIMPLTESSGLHGLITRDSLDQDSDWALVYDDESIKFYINGNTSLPASSGSVSNNTWYHVVAWWDAANHTANIQLNNGTVVSTSYGSTDRNWNGDNPRLTFGAFDHSTSKYPWNGRIGPAAFWNRLLTADERQALWNAGNGVTYPFPTLAY